MRLLPQLDYWVLNALDYWLLILDRNTYLKSVGDITCSHTHAWMIIKPNQLVENIFGIMLGQCIGHVHVHLHLPHTTSTNMFLQSSIILIYVNLVLKVYTPYKFDHMQYMCTQCTRSVCEESIPTETICHMGQHKFSW